MSFGDSEQVETSAVSEQTEESQKPEAANLPEHNNQANSSEIPDPPEKDQQADTAQQSQQTDLADNSEIPQSAEKDQPADTAQQSQQADLADNSEIPQSAEKDQQADTAQQSQQTDLADNSEIPQSAEKDQPADTAQQSQQADLADNSEIPQSAEKDQQADTAQQSQQTDPANSSEIPEPTDKSQQADTAQQSQQTDPANSSEIPEPTDKSQQADASQQSQQTDPANSSEIPEPTDKSQQADASQQPQPTDPANSSEIPEPTDKSQQADASQQADTASTAQQTEQSDHVQTADSDDKASISEQGPVEGPDDEERSGQELGLEQTEAAETNPPAEEEQLIEADESSTSGIKAEGKQEEEQEISEPEPVESSEEKQTAETNPPAEEEQLIEADESSTSEIKAEEKQGEEQEISEPEPVESSEEDQTVAADRSAQAKEEQPAEADETPAVNEIRSEEDNPTSLREPEQQGQSETLPEANPSVEEAPTTALPPVQEHAERNAETSARPEPSQDSDVSDQTTAPPPAELSQTTLAEEEDHSPADSSAEEVEPASNLETPELQDNDDSTSTQEIPVEIAANDRIDEPGTVQDSEDEQGELGAETPEEVMQNHASLDSSAHLSAADDQAKEAQSQSILQDALASKQRADAPSKGEPGYTSSQKEAPVLDRVENKTPEPGTPDFSLYAQRAFSSRFSETPAVNSLWKQASEGRENSRQGFEGAQKEFWRLVRDESNADKQIAEDARIVRAILEEAGLDLTGNDAPKLNTIPTPDVDETSEEYSTISKIMIDEVNLKSRRGKPLTEEQHERRQVLSGTLDIDHADPGSIQAQETDPLKKIPRAWVNPVNLQFMFADDNRIHKGNRARK